MSCGPDLHTNYRNRYCLDRSDCRSLPGGDSGHSCKGERYSPSAATADENWNMGENGYIIIQARALHGWGCGIGGLARSRSGIARVSTALSLYPILFLMSLPVADLLMINGHPARSWAFAKYERVLIAIYSISLSGTGESPSAPVFIDGEKLVTLKGDGIASQFMEIVDRYVRQTYGRKPS